MRFERTAGNCQARNNANVGQFSWQVYRRRQNKKRREHVIAKRTAYSRFLKIFSLPEALSADALDTATQQNMLMRIVRLG
jgi:hypothetical protein